MIIHHWKKISYKESEFIKKLSKKSYQNYNLNFWDLSN